MVSTGHTGDTVCSVTSVTPTLKNAGSDSEGRGGTWGLHFCHLPRDPVPLVPGPPAGVLSHRNTVPGRAPRSKHGPGPTLPGHLRNQWHRPYGVQRGAGDVGM